MKKVDHKEKVFIQNKWWYVVRKLASNSGVKHERRLSRDFAQIEYVIVVGNAKNGVRKLIIAFLSFSAVREETTWVCTSRQTITRRCDAMTAGACKKCQVLHGRSRELMNKIALFKHSWR
ncbi:hypothetical protein EVAR_84835_1 [Eumeta japonica]|uniref:Uncharacterized protein n=1 Tax=Eumeta variegata TaxID=151549 RepID=A0A4C1U882_EUMVA|nr:hypothetical protein EVAR_84835_1 [Eumeta japonica]